MCQLAPAKVINISYPGLPFDEEPEMQLCLALLKPYYKPYLYIVHTLSMITLHSLLNGLFTTLNQRKFATKAGGGRTRKQTGNFYNAHKDKAT